eukprot:TRINITY_DN3103_c1_g1_i1.p1 TRINITY_DN3103_c1_g1~~TRINITY_DN3103_c1_g1_i1.p1  ORF type:complete len:233 (+),score=48.61 TRINITY_DN3103_c1_g1_i1:197-895(+)
MDPEELDKNLKSITAELDALLAETKAIPPTNKAARDQKLSAIRAVVKRGRIAVKSLKSELRANPSIATADWRRRVTEHENSLNKADADVAFLEKGDSADGAAAGAGAQTTDSILAQANATQEQTLKIAQEALGDVQKTQEVGISTLAQMQTNTETMKKANEDLADIQQDLVLARKELRDITRKLASDKIILVLIGLVLCAAIAAVLYAIISPGGNKGSEVIPSPSPSPTSGL